MTPKVRKIHLDNADRHKLTQAKRAVNPSLDTILWAIGQTNGLPVEIAAILQVTPPTVVAWAKTIPAVAVAMRLRVQARRHMILGDVMQSALSGKSFHEKALAPRDHLAYQQYATDLMRQEEDDLAALLPKEDQGAETYTLSFTQDEPPPDAAPQDAPDEGAA